ncbi:hypothetical protein PQ676_04925 [Rickettsia felis]|nr:hypothetical protein [Rickettsia felis]MDE8611563.1 hypothetical protein [Rickettsia felis]
MDNLSYKEEFEGNTEPQRTKAYVRIRVPD